MDILKVKKAIKSYRDKNSLSFGYRILDTDISNESDFVSAITFLNTDGSEWEETNPVTWSNVDTENTVLENEATAKATAKATAQASGNTKLLGLGLSQEEATALTGYTPE
tara:strand:+ start:461 stop:790 length:330 start_codon:yes stop_codon:yes gene_type:complete